MSDTPVKYKATKPRSDVKLSVTDPKHRNAWHTAIIYVDSKDYNYLDVLDNAANDYFFPQFFYAFHPYDYALPERDHEGTLNLSVYDNGYDPLKDERFDLTEYMAARLMGMEETTGFGAFYNYLTSSNYCALPLPKMKKPHIHLIVKQVSNYTNQQCSYQLGIPVNHVQGIRDVKSSVRYLIHTDEPSPAFHYPKDSLITNTDPAKYFKDSDEDVMAQDIMEHIFAGDFKTYQDFMTWIFNRKYYAPFRRGFASFVPALQIAGLVPMPKGGLPNRDSTNPC